MSGVIPGRPDELVKSLPGVGRYTAGKVVPDKMGCGLIVGGCGLMVMVNDFFCFSLRCSDINCF
jgi:hypothetical protein